MLAVLKKEIKTYFLSVIGYVFIGLLLAMCSVFFYITAILQGVTNFEYLFYYAAQVLTFITPVLTMRMFSEERKNGTEQLLLTSPRNVTGIVLGKFIAAVVVIIIGEILTLTYFGILCYFKMPYIGTSILALLGFLLLSMAYISFGMFISSLTENQIIAGVVTIGAFIISWFLPNIHTKFAEFSIIDKFYKFPAGLISIADVVNLVTFTVMFIIFTIMVIKRRKIVH